jgi:hypothetical protein
MLKASRDDAGAVLAAIRDARRRGVAEPVSWIMGVLKARPPNKAAFISSRPSTFNLSKPVARA